jgi:hypothetical protein
MSNLAVFVHSNDTYVKALLSNDTMSILADLVLSDDTTMSTLADCVHSDDTTMSKTGGLCAQ